MRTSFINRVMLVGLFGAVVMCGLLFSQAVAQGDCNNPNVKCGKKRPTPTPATPKRKQRRTVQAAQRPAEPLSFQWGVQPKFDDDKRKASITETYTSRDRFRLYVKIRESGYLYVIRQQSANGNGTLVFPSRYYNRSEDRVLIDDEFILPDCLNNSIGLTPPITDEKWTVILSRKPITDFQQKPPPGGALTILNARISSLRVTPGQQSSNPSGGTDETYNTWVVLATRPEIERIIETVTFTNRAGVVKIVPASVARN